MNRTLSLFATVGLVSALAPACGSDGPGEPLWPLDGQPVCEGAEIDPLNGSNPMVIHELEIGELEDGFDLDNDGDPDNKLSAVGSLARSSIDDSFEQFDIVIPFEFFDFDDPFLNHGTAIRWDASLRPEPVVRGTAPALHLLSSLDLQYLVHVSSLLVGGWGPKPPPWLSQPHLRT